MSDGQETRPCRVHLLREGVGPVEIPRPMSELGQEQPRTEQVRVVGVQLALPAFEHRAQQRRGGLVVAQLALDLRQGEPGDQQPAVALRKGPRPDLVHAQAQHVSPFEVPPQPAHGRDLGLRGQHVRVLGAVQALPAGQGLLGLTLGSAEVVPAPLGRGQVEHRLEHGGVSRQQHPRARGAQVRETRVRLLEPTELELHAGHLPQGIQHLRVLGRQHALADGEHLLRPRERAGEVAELVTKASQVQLDAQGSGVLDREQVPVGHIGLFEEARRLLEVPEAEERRPQVRHHAQGAGDAPAGAIDPSPRGHAARARARSPASLRPTAR